AFEEHGRVFHLGVTAVSMRWFAVIVLYGAFIPNTWKRCLTVVTSVTAAPIVLFFMLCIDSAITSSLWPNALFEMVILLCIAAAPAIFGSHRISELQQQAFEAKKLGQYHLKKKIGSGGMGDVYLAEHARMRRQCALKTIKSDQTSDPLTLAR